MLRFDHVSLTYGTQKILNDISFEIPEGQFAVFIGPSGCGKTTTLKMINRLIQPDSGRICLNGQDIAAIDRYELRRHTGYVIQQIGLFPNMTVAQNICVVPKLLKWPRDKCDQIVHDLLDMVDMPYDQYAHKFLAPVLSRLKNRNTTAARSGYRRKNAVSFFAGWCRKQWSARSWSTGVPKAST